MVCMQKLCITEQVRRSRVLLVKGAEEEVSQSKCAEAGYCWASAQKQKISVASVQRKGIFAPVRRSRVLLIKGAEEGYR